MVDLPFASSERLANGPPLALALHAQNRKSVRVQVADGEVGQGQHGRALRPARRGAEVDHRVGTGFGLTLAGEMFAEAGDTQRSR